MSRTLTLLSRPGYPHTCTYRRNCKGEVTHRYSVPFVNRYGNLKERSTTVCRECADRIMNKYTVEVDG